MTEHNINNIVLLNKEISEDLLLSERSKSSETSFINGSSSKSAINNAVNSPFLFDASLQVVFQVYFFLRY